ncbi:hypothetical protein HKX42_05765 [Salinisphaera sp. USBA-960]|nr:hypothetical protein [Salifodinibacter halophilus]
MSISGYYNPMDLSPAATHPRLRQAVRTPGWSGALTVLRGRVLIGPEAHVGAE